MNPYINTLDSKAQKLIKADITYMLDYEGESLDERQQAIEWAMTSKLYDVRHMLTDHTLAIIKTIINKWTKSA